MKGKEIKVLDKGFVRLVDYMGDDSSIVQAARVSYGNGTKTVNEDRGLINYLLEHSHNTPFEMVEFKFHMKMPIFIARQIIRHRTANVNELSGRYSEMKDEFYLPETSRIQIQSKDNKQGSGDALPEEIQRSVVESMHNEQTDAYELYQAYLSDGVAKEISRINLPLSLYTEWYWKIDLHNLLHFLRLRLDSHAQYEVRVFAEAIYELIKPIVPMACDAFEEHTLHSVKFSRTEMKLIKQLLGNLTMESGSSQNLESAGVALGLSKRQAKAFVSKIS